MPTNVHRYVGTRHSSRGSHEGRCPSIAPQRTVLLCLFLPSWPRMPECALTLRPQPWAGAVSPTYGPLPQPEGSMPLSRRPRAEWHRGRVENRRGGGDKGWCIRLQARRLGRCSRPQAHPQKHQPREKKRNRLLVMNRALCRDLTSVLDVQPRAP